MRTYSDFIDMCEEQGVLDHELDDPDATTDALVELGRERLNGSTQNLWMIHDGKVYLLPAEQAAIVARARAQIEEALKHDVEA